MKTRLLFAAAASAALLFTGCEGDYSVGGAYVGGAYAGPYLGGYGPYYPDYGSYYGADLVINNNRYPSHFGYHHFYPHSFGVRHFAAHEGGNRGSFHGFGGGGPRGGGGRGGSHR